MKPNFTLNYGVRWEVLLPFYPLTGNRSMSTIDGRLRPVGLRRRRRRTPVQHVQSGRPQQPDADPDLRRLQPGRSGLRHQVVRLRAERRRRVAAERAGRPRPQDPRRSGSGDGSRRCSRTSFNRPRMDAFTGLFNGNPGGTAPGGANRSTAAGNYPLVLPGESLAGALPRDQPPRTAGLRADADVSRSRRRSRAATTSTCSTRRSSTPYTQLLVGRPAALGGPRHGRRAALRRHRAAPSPSRGPGNASPPSVPSESGYPPPCPWPRSSP